MRRICLIFLLLCLAALSRAEAGLKDRVFEKTLPQRP